MKPNVLINLVLIKKISVADARARALLSLTLRYEPSSLPMQQLRHSLSLHSKAPYSDRNPPGTPLISPQRAKPPLGLCQGRIFADFLRDWRTSDFDTFSIKNSCLDRFENSRISSTQIGQLHVSRQQHQNGRFEPLPNLQSLSLSSTTKPSLRSCERR